MERNIDAKLLAWKNSEFRKPLLIRGARQVGKTYSVCEFGKKQFKTFIKLDFERDRTAQNIFSGDLAAQKLLLELEVYTNTAIIPGETLVFFDEIQECERALLSLRYFYEEVPDLHVIAAGSMLEFALGNVSFPVGRMFYWSRAKKSSSAEVDYLFVKKGIIFPLEVKRGPAGRLKSLHIFLNEHPRITRGYVLSPMIFEEQHVKNFIFMPIYTRFD